jgi:hypothetical protein
MAIKEYRVAQADTRPIRRRPLSMVRNLVPSQKDSKVGDNAPMRTKDQPAITAQGRSPRYDADSIMGVISSLRSPGEANTAYDPSKPIGGENVPYKPTTGIGGVLSRFFGNQANEMNVAAQEQQAAEKMAEEATAKERAFELEKIREADKAPAERFKISQTAADKAEANRLAAENKRLELEGERLGLTKQQIEDARLDRIERLKGEQADREARIEDMRTRNALADAAFGRSMLPSAQAISTGQGGVLMYDPRSGQPIGTFSSPTIGEITNPKTGEKSFGPTGGGYEPYVPPVTVPKDLPDSPQVDRTTGAVPSVPPLDTKLPPGGGVKMGGRLPSPETTPMRAAAPSPVADASLLGRFREAMPSLGFNQPSARGYTAPEMTEGDVAQQAMSQIAYPLRAAAAEEFKGEYENPDVAARVMAGAPPFPRFRKPSATEMSQARKAGSLIRQMYAE